MTDFINYIESNCSKLKKGRMAYLYKRKLLDEMTARAQEIAHAGITDEKVIRDLITDELGDLSSGYASFEKEEKTKRFHKKLPLIGIISLILILAAYFAVSGVTGAWSKTWLIIVGGVFALIVFFSTVAARKLCTMSAIYHTGARVLIAACTMLISVFVFLYCLMMLPGVITWPIVIGGVALMLLCDLGFSYATKQKFRTITFFIYMPAVATMLYIILAAYGILTWTGGWVLVLAGLAVDLAYIIAVIAGNIKYFMYRQEAEEQ